jgi:hypothetical protein
MEVRSQDVTATATRRDLVDGIAGRHGIHNLNPKRRL